MIELAKKAKHILIRHYEALFVQLDVVQLQHQELFYRTHLLFGVILYGGIVLYGLFGLDYESRHVLDLTTALTSSPYSFLHQCLPPSVWRHVDPALYLLILSTLLSWFVLSYISPIRPQFRIYPHSSQIPRKDLLLILKYRQRWRRWATILFVGVISTGSCSMYLHVLLLNQVYTTTVASLVFWSLLLYFIIYVAHFLYGMPFFIILASKYITIQQKSLLKEFSLLNSALCVHSKPSMGLWFRYLSLHRHLIFVCIALNEYARFWSGFLTILFGCIISVQCYFFYAFLFVRHLPLLLRLMFLLISAALVLVEFVLIDQGARVVKSNRKITRQCHLFQWNFRVAQNKAILARHLLKAESLQDTRLLHNYAFRLFGNYRITSKSFHSIISYVSIFFLYIIKTGTNSVNIQKSII